MTQQTQAGGAGDPAHDVLRQERQPLQFIFNPRNVAVIGATETPNSVGRTVLRNLIGNPFGGTVFPVNLKRPNVLGTKAYPSIGAVPEQVDLAVVCTPAATVPAIIGECVDAGVPGAIVISAGFKELGPPGVELERQVLANARRGRMRLIGPNCLGLMNPVTGLNATFAGAMARPGNVAFISQSGALLTAILDWSFKEQVGFSAFVSTGSMLDVGWGDLIDHLGNDPNTHSILVYMESIGDARSFLSAAREVALSKPIIVIKPGRSEQAAKAAASHTGSLTGSDEVLQAAFRRSGVLRVDNIADLFYMAETLGKQPRPRGPRLTILTNAGGPGVLATDALVASGGELAPLAPETLAACNALLPPHWSRNNPIDILGDAGAERYVKTLEVAAEDPNSDGLLVVLTPQDMTDATRTAEALRPYAQIAGKPVLASWMGGPGVAAGEAILNAAGIPTFPYPDTAARAFAYMWRYTYNLRALYETAMPDEEAEEHPPDRDAAKRIIDDVRASGREILTEYESKSLLAAYRIPTVPTAVAADEATAVRLADGTGYPVVLKLHSLTITHKTDVGGIQLNLGDADAVRRAFHAIRHAVAAKAGPEHFQGVTVQPMVKLADAYELIVGSSIDPQFGPVLLFGTGGQLVEVFKDRALGLPPLTRTLACRMMEQTKIYTALKGVRGRRPVDLGALERLLVRFSLMVVEQPWIREVDINPLLASGDGLVALDARVLVHGSGLTTAAQLPRPAIRPYPTQYVTSLALGDNTPIMIRPIRPDDEPAMVRFHAGLSERTVHLRYFSPLKLGTRTAHSRLSRIVFTDYDREMVMVVERLGVRPANREILGVGRLSKLPGGAEAEFALLISDQWQRRGLGSRVLRHLLKVAADENIARVTADILPENKEMQHVAEKAGFTLSRGMTDRTVRAEMTLRGG